MNPIKLLVQIILVLAAAVSLPIFFALPLLFPIIGADLSDALAEQAITTTIVIVEITLALFSIGVVLVAWRFLHKRPVRDMGFGGPLIKGLVIGHGVGLAMALVAFLIETVVFGFPTMTWAVPATVGVGVFLAHYALYFFVILTLSSLKEELLFRSYILEGIGDKLSRWPNILIACLLFSLVHVLLEPPMVLPFVSRFMFGVLCCQFYLHYRSVWLSLGLHNGWNGFTSAFYSDEWTRGQLFTLENWDTGVESFIVVVSILTIAIIVFETKIASREKPSEEPIEAG
jgi:membrane protease YdiL (CAAX protease family)